MSYSGMCSQEDSTEKKKAFLHSFSRFVPYRPHILCWNGRMEEIADKSMTFFISQEAILAIGSLPRGSVT